MTTCKFFDAPRFHDADFYRDREVADHIHEPGHRERLLRALHDVLYLLDIDAEAATVGDFGCGNGGLLYELYRRRPDVEAWGYDLSPKAVEHARQVYGVDVSLCDFTADAIRMPSIAIVTETLEHLVDPEALLTKLRDGGVKWIVASVPANETAAPHYEFHLWAWDGPAFNAMFRKLGYTVIAHYSVAVASCQHLIALNGAALAQTASTPAQPAN
jgi:trans-aconitate methyltransferase